MDSNQLSPPRQSNWRCVRLLVGINTIGSFVFWDARVCDKLERGFSRRVEMQFGATKVPRRHRRKGIECRGLGLECSIWQPDELSNTVMCFVPSSMLVLLCHLQPSVLAIATY